MKLIKLLILSAIVTIFMAGAALSQDQDLFNAEMLDDGTVLIQHLNAYHNCCSYISNEVTVEGFTIYVTDTEPVHGACWCICYFDVEAVVSDLSAGIYTIEYTYDTNYSPSSEDWQTEIFGIVVPQWSAPPVEPGFVSSTSECHGGESVSVEDIDWSRIKSIYR